MNRLLVGAAAAALAISIAPALAQTAGAPPAPVAAPVPAPSSPTQQVRVKVMSDKVMTRAEVDQHIRKIFAMLDTNHDGFVTREETASAAQGMMAMHGDMAKRLADRGMLMGDRSAIFDRLDANHDGSISRQEFMASQPQAREQRMIIMREGNGPASNGQPAAPQAPGVHGMHMFGMGMRGFGGHLFEMADANNDGRVSLQEAETAALAHFDRADLNHDGKLTPEERQQAHQLRRLHRAG
jgi:Ca2+-binding EF-hand superfamily protein